MQKNKFSRTHACMYVRENLFFYSAHAHGEKKRSGIERALRRIIISARAHGEMKRSGIERALRRIISARAQVEMKRSGIERALRFRNSWTSNEKQCKITNIQQNLSGRKI